MKARITILALVFLLLGVTNADAQKHHYHKGKKMYARHGYYHKGHPRHYGGHRYRYRNVRYAEPVRHYYYPARYSRRAVYARPYPGRHHSRAPHHRPGIHASIFLP